MDTNKFGKRVPNDQCCICAESPADVPREEHAGPGGHVDFLAAAGRVSGWSTPAPPAAETAAAFRTWLISRLSTDLAEAEARGKLAVATGRWRDAALLFGLAAELEQRIAELRAAPETGQTNIVGRPTVRG